MADQGEEMVSLETDWPKVSRLRESSRLAHGHQNGSPAERKNGLLAFSVRAAVIL